MFVTKTQFIDDAIQALQNVKTDAMKEQKMLDKQAALNAAYNNGSSTNSSSAGTAVEFGYDSAMSLDQAISSYQEAHDTLASIAADRVNLWRNENGV